ncbi:hypothetical protein BDZ85DRAFT_263192 [Elsinoe ampelina]|uniref:DUF4419 domain-containing protein n=1 Tax=Elsinoe ampelina TaxID=302913 RepID=A0A6A6GCE1_9PEZI|nr:hypothetical protein BDZ85DRAFT_263192 [Elsinoe ampelina]
MPVTLRIPECAPRKVYCPGKDIKTTEELFKSSCPDDTRKSKRVLQSSFTNEFLQQNHVHSCSNGFVRAAVDAYSGHHHLTIRPEDVWFAILSQLSFYINAHAEELRHFFVAHEGQKEVEVVSGGNIYTVDMGQLARAMTTEMQKHICDPDLRTWVMPNFSTTTDQDRATAAVLMMGSLQKYFKYQFTLRCGLPSITLLGERSDWEKILLRLDKLSMLGSETTTFMNLLRPILRRFVESFDDQPSPSVYDFWTKIAHHTGGSGPKVVTGWITGFCFWNSMGECLVGSTTAWPKRSRHVGLELDEMVYHAVDSSDIPPGHASVPMTVDDNGRIYKTRMVAGSFAQLVTRSGGLTRAMEIQELHRNGHSPVVRPEDDPQELLLDSLQPISGWLMYERTAEDDSDTENNELKELKGRTAQQGVGQDALLADNTREQLEARRALLLAHQQAIAEESAKRVTPWIPCTMVHYPRKRKRVRASSGE